MTLVKSDLDYLGIFLLNEEEKKFCHVKNGLKYYFNICKDYGLPNTDFGNI